MSSAMVPSPVSVSTSERNRTPSPFSRPKAGVSSDVPEKYARLTQSPFPATRSVSPQ